MVVHKRKNKYERGSYIFVEWSCANKRNITKKTLNFGRMVLMKEDYIFLSKGCVQMKEISQ